MNPVEEEWQRRRLSAAAQSAVEEILPTVMRNPTETQKTVARIVALACFTKGVTDDDAIDRLVRRAVVREAGRLQGAQRAGAQSWATSSRSPTREWPRSRDGKSPQGHPETDQAAAGKIARGHPNGRDELPQGIAGNRHRGHLDQAVVHVDPRGREVAPRGATPRTRPALPRRSGRRRSSRTWATMW